MAVPESEINPRIVEVLKRARDLPSVPAVAMEVLRVARDEAADAEALASVVSLDPALSAKILKVSNSALFRGASEIVTLKRACSQLGFKTIKLWALSFAMVDSLERPDVEEFDYEEYWKRSILRGVAAKLLAEVAAPRLAEEAFITGLLSRIGQLVLANCLPNEYSALMAASSENWPSQELQQETLGFSSDELGVALLQSWKLPPLIYESMAQAQNFSRTRDGAPDGTCDLARILNVAGCCEELVFGGKKSKILVELHKSGRELLGLEQGQIEDLLFQLNRSTSEIAQVLCIHIEGGLDIEAVLRTAQLDILRETIALLHDAVVTDRRAAQLEFENSVLLLKAKTDSLTGLADRGTFEEALAGCVLRCPDGGRRFAVGLLMIDIDGFKAVNDTYGHLVGDQVLRSVARVIREAIRGDDLAARYGGDEFIIVLPRATGDSLKSIAERIRTGVETRRLIADSVSIPVTVSIGGAHSEIFESVTSPMKLVEIVDQCLYAAKRRGRNRCEFASTESTLPSAH